MRKIMVIALAALIVLPLSVFASGGKEGTTATGAAAATTAATAIVSIPIGASS